VRKNGHAAAQRRVIAYAGIEVKGRLSCVRAETAGNAYIGPKAMWEGDLSASSLVVEPGAVIRGGHFRVPLDPLEAHRYQEEVPGGEEEDP